MINVNAFKLAHKRYAPEDMPFLTEARILMQKSNKYKGLKILQNIPLTIEAVLKIEPLVLGGADVTVSCISILNPRQEAIEILKQANIKVQIQHKFNETFDFCLDCSGEMINILEPTIGSVELTQTGSEIYKKANRPYPVISV